MATSKISSNTWKLVGTQTGTTAIALPNDFSELLVWVSLDRWDNVSFNISRGMLWEQTNYFSTGAYASSSANKNATVQVSLTTASLSSYITGGVNKTADTSITVYYK